MKPNLFMALLLSVTMANGQTDIEKASPVTPGFSLATAPMPAKDPPGKDIQLNTAKWKITSNHIWTGGLVLVAGAAKGFNETLHFHWKEFKRQFPKANPEWFYPGISWKNKYKNNDPNAGPKYFLSTSVLIMFTDQYHLNNLVNKLAWGSALVIKLGEGKKPFKKYLLDLLYYTACHQAGFATTYYPFSKYKGK